MPEVESLYRTREVSELLDWPVSRVYGFIRAGLVDPSRDTGGSFVFSFRDLVVLRAARELIDQGLPTRKVKRSLASVAHLLPDGRPLSTVRLSRAGDSVVVRDGELWWDVESGQGHMLFDAPGEVRESAAPPADSAADSDEWYDRGIDLEDSDPAEAMRAYARAIALDPKQADAHINLGRLLQLDGRLDEAERHYLTALERSPGNPIANFNLGTLMEDRGRVDEALTAYRAALPDLTDAHHNLARLYDQMGRRLDAMRHLKALRVLERG